MTHFKHLMMMLAPITLLLVFAGPMAKADVTAKSDFYFPMKLSDYSSILSAHPLSGLDQSVLPNYQFTKPFKTSIMNTTLNIGYTAQVQPKDTHGNFSFKLDVTQSSFQAEKVVTDDVIVKNVGGISVTVYLKGVCTGVGFHSTTPSSVEGTFDVVAEGAQLVAHIDTLTVTGLGNWNVSVGHCEGPVGYQQALEAELKKFAGDQKSMTDMFRTQLQAKLNSVIADMTSKVMVERHIQVNDKINMVLNPSGIYINKDSGQVILYGAATTVISSPRNDSIEVPATFAPEDEKSFSQSGFILSQDYINALSKALYQTGIYGYAFNSNTSSDLKSLFGNRFFQFFLWRDLVSFKLDSIFNFSAHAVQEPKIQALGSNAGYAWFNLAGPVATDIQAPKNDQYVAYMTVNSTASVNAWVGVLQGKVLIGFQNAKLDSTKKWDANYQAQYRPSDSMNLGYFSGKVVDLINKKRFLFSLPNVEVGDSQVLAPQSFSSTKKWVQIVYQPTKGN